MQDLYTEHPHLQNYLFSSDARFKEVYQDSHSICLNPEYIRGYMAAVSKLD